MDAARLDENESGERGSAGQHDRDDTDGCASLAEPAPGDPKSDAGSTRAHEPVDGDRVAGGMAPVFRRHSEQEADRRAGGGSEAELRKRPRAFRRAPCEAQRQRRAAHHEKRQALESDRHRKPGQRACKHRGVARAIRPGGGRDHAQGEHDLHVVMIDAAGPKMLERRPGAGRDDERDARRMAPGNSPGERGRAAHGAEQQEERPRGAHEALGELGIGKPAKHEKEPGKAAVDKPGPMGVVAGRRIEPRLMQVEPAASGQEFAHLHEPHGVVGVEHPLAHLRPAIDEENAGGHRPGQSEQDAEMEPGARCGHERDTGAAGSAMPQEH